METPKSTSLPEISTPNHGGSTSEVEQSEKQKNWELVRSGEPGSEMPAKVEKLGTLQKIIGQNASSIDGLKQLVRRERADLASVRNSLGTDAPSNDIILPSENALQELEARQQELQQERMELVREESNNVLQENVTSTFAIFKKLSSEEFELVLQTGEIPEKYITLWQLFKMIFGKQPIESRKEYTIILARAFKRGVTTISTISEEFPEFTKLRADIEPMIQEIAANRILNEPEQKQIAEGETAQELSHTEQQRQIPETSSVIETHTSLTGSGASPISSK